MKDSFWHDRMRILGLPISFTRYYLLKDKLIHSKGLFMVNEGEIMLYRILDVEIQYSLLDRILGVGTIVLYGADVSDKKFYIKRIKNPREVLNQLNELVEAERVRLGIKGKELFGSMTGAYA
jgi:uncharacterized membrane protein YdbT with pleckstrin-like domain